MSTPFVPWNSHPGLTEERLTIVGEVIREARHQVAKRHEPSMGDDPWTQGCRAFKWCCYALAQAVATHGSWMAVTEGGKDDDEGVALVGHRFVFTIGGVPIRFYRGLADEVPSRTLRRHYEEIEAHQLAFAFVPKPRVDRIYRLAVETDDFGEVSRIVLLKVDEAEGEPLEHYIVPPAKAPAKVTQFRTREEGKKLDEPKVGSKRKDAKKLDEDA